MSVKTLTVGPISTNCYIVDTGKETNVVIDPGFESDIIETALTDFSKKTTHIIYTHAHWDHVGAGKAVKDFTGAEVVMGRKDSEMLKYAPESALNLSGIKISPAQPDRLVDDGDIIKSGDIEFKVAETPGHTPGCISLFCDYGIFCGDTIFFNSIGRTDFPGGDREAIIKSIEEKIFTAPENLKLYTGHGQATTVGREKKENPFFN